jgi:hypothetical protein
VAITTTADRRSSKGSSRDHTAAIGFDAREYGMPAGLGEYQSPSRSLNPSCLPFQPEDTISIVTLLVRSRRPQAKPAPGTLNSSSLGPPDLASVLSTILQKDPKYCHRATSTPSGKVGPSCRRHPALLVNPACAPPNRDRISIGQRPRKLIRVEGRPANASQK